MTKFEKRIDDIKEDGWWKRDTGDTYRSIGNKMKAMGIDEDVIVNWLNNLYWSAADEYGA